MVFGIYSATEFGLTGWPAWQKAQVVPAQDGLNEELACMDE